MKLRFLTERVHPACRGSHRLGLARLTCAAALLSLNMAVSAAESSKQWQDLQSQAQQQLTRGQYDRAMQAARKALTLAENGKGATAPYIASSLNIMALIEDAQGDTATALMHQKRAVDLFLDSVGNHENTATLLVNLAKLYEKQGQLSDALDAWQQADRMLTTLAQSRPSTAVQQLQGKVLIAIQQNLQAQGKGQAAQSYAGRHYDLAMRMANASESSDADAQGAPAGVLLVLAQQLQAQGEHRKSEDVVQLVLKTLQQTKTDTPDPEWIGNYANALEISIGNLSARNVADATSVLHLHQQALDFYLQLSQSQQQDFADRIANHYNETGFLYYQQQQFAQAQQAFSRAQALIVQRYGENSLENALALRNIAQALDGQKSYKDALAIYARILDIQKMRRNALETEADLAAWRQAYLQSLNDAAVACYGAKNYPRAQRYWEEGLALYDAYATDAGIQAFAMPVMENLQKLYQSLGRADDAKRLAYRIRQLRHRDSQ